MAGRGIDKRKDTLRYGQPCSHFVPGVLSHTLSPPLALPRLLATSMLAQAGTKTNGDVCNFVGGNQWAAAAAYATCDPWDSIVGP